MRETQQPNLETTMTAINERFDSLREAKSAAINICAEARETIYVLRFAREIPEFFRVVNEAGRDEYRGKHVSTIAWTVTA